MGDFTKDDYNYMANNKRYAFVKIAEKLGKDHPITKMMGSRAWGRHPYEQGMKHTLRGAIMDMAALDGAFDILNLWARDNDQLAQRIMLGIYPLSWAGCPSSQKKAEPDAPPSLSTDGAKGV